MAQLGLNTVIGSTLNLIKKTHARFLLEYKTNPSYALSVINSDDIVMISTILANIRIGDIRNRIIKPGTFGFMTVYYNIQKDWTNYYLSVNKLKFALYIVFMLFIFALLWNKMVANMRNDIEKTLGILNVLPTVHLSSSPDFIKELNASSLIR